MPLTGERHFCSKCGQAMEWRLSRWECSGCGNADDPMAGDAARRKLEELERISELRGNIRPIQHKPVYQDGKIVGYESDEELTTYAPPTSSALLNPGASFYGKVDDLRAERPRVQSIETEKKIFFAVQSTAVALSLLLSLAMSIIPPGPYFAFGLGAIVITGIGLYLLWFALFGDQEWAKWLCAGLQGLAIIGCLLAMFWVMVVDSTEFQSIDYQMRGSLSLVLWGGGTLYLFFGFWLIGILYRDSHVLRGKL